ncbi:MAG: hypothetical protein SGPRY_012184, partial [Prymnesium sp.]
MATCPTCVERAKADAVRLQQKKEIHEETSEVMHVGCPTFKRRTRKVRKPMRVDNINSGDVANFSLSSAPYVLE